MLSQYDCSFNVKAAIFTYVHEATFFFYNQRNKKVLLRKHYIKSKWIVYFSEHRWLNSVAPGPVNYQKRSE